MSITDLTAVELSNLIKKKELSPVDVVTAYVDRIDKLNPQFNAYVTLNEQAIEEAKKSEETVMRGEDLGELHGIPVAIKDLTPTKGLRTTYGSPLFKDHIPDYDPTFVKRIKAAGGIILGKTNTPEFGHKGTTDNPLFGVTKNPWNESLTPGGSSGGAAAAVAAKLAPIAEGSDGGGSIRIPASLTGIFGLKPTFGVVPHDEELNNLFGYQHPYLHNGPMARTVEDASLLFSIMRGYDVNEPDSIPTNAVQNVDLNGSLKGLKIAYTRNFGLHEISNDVIKSTDKACENLASLGCEVEEVKVDLGLSADEVSKVFGGLWSVKFAASYGHYYDENPDNFSESLANTVEIGRKLSAVDYKALEIDRTKIWTGIQSLLNDYDFIVSPTLTTTAFPHHLPGPPQINGKSVEPGANWIMTPIYNLTGHPAASLPVGLTDDGLPVGLQVASSRFADNLILQLCHNYEKAFETYIDPLKE